MRAQWLVFSAIFSVTACSASDAETEDIVGPTASGLLSPAALFEAGAGDSILTFWISGPNKAHNAGMTTFTIRDLAGDFGIPDSYDVHWYVERCFDGEVTCRPPVAGPAGAQMDTLQFYADADLWQFTVSAQVRAGGYTGGAHAYQTLGPALFPSGNDDSISFCDGTANFFPFEGNWQSSQDSTPEYYYRNACDGQREWSDNPFQNTPPN